MKLKSSNEYPISEFFSSQNYEISERERWEMKTINDDDDEKNHVVKN